MTKIPYNFNTPIPVYFQENGWFENPNSILFLHWAFSRCHYEARTVVHDYTELNLEPYEFIAGLGKSSKQAHLTESAFKHQLKILQKAGLLKITSNSRTNRFTCYIWVWSRFSKPNNQLNNQVTTNSRPTERPQSRREKIRSKEKDHPSIPSVIVDDHGMIDDFSSKKDLYHLGSDSYATQHNRNYQPEDQRVEIISGVFLSQNELEACIKIKGDLEKVKEAIAFIQESKKRKHEIADWPNALAKWKIDKSKKIDIQKHIAYAEKLCKLLPDFETKKGWRCSIYHDKKKDQKGLLFEPESVYLESVFISFIDPEFLKKSFTEVVNKKLNFNSVSQPKIVGIND